MGAIGAHVTRSVRTAVPPTQRDVEIRIDVDATQAIAALIRARAQASKLEIAWRMAVSSQARDERRAAARARRDRQRAERVAAGTDRTSLRLMKGRHHGHA